MIRRIIRVLLILLVGVLAVAAIGWAWLWHTESGAAWAWQQARQAVADSRGASLEARIRGTLGAGLDLTDIAYRDENVAATAARARLEVDFRTSPVSLLVRRLDLADVELELADTTSEEDGGQAQWPDSLALPLPIELRNLRIERAAIRRADTNFAIRSITATGRWHRSLALQIASLEAEDMTASLRLDALLRAPYPLEAEIEVARYTLPPQARDSAPWLPESMASKVRMTGDLNTLGVEGEFRWPDFIPAAAFSGEITRPVSDPQWTLAAELPDVNLPSQLGLQDLVVEASGAGLQLEFSGRGEAGSPWTRNARVQFSGTLDEGGLQHWAAEGTADVSYESWPQAGIEFTGKGDGDTMRFGLSAPQLFGGSLIANATAPSGAQAMWLGEFAAEGLEVKPLLEALAPHFGDTGDNELGRIADTLQSDTINAQARLGLGIDPLFLEADIVNLDGRVRGRGVNASGRLVYADDLLRAEAFSLRSGRSRALIDGPLYGPPGLNIEVDIATLDDFLPGASGSLAGTVRYRHDPERGFAGSRIRADLRGKAIRALDWQIDDLRIAPPDSPAGDAPLALWLTAEGLAGKGVTIEQLSASLEGDLERQEVALSARLPHAGLTARVTGGTSTAPIKGWRGTLEDFSFDPHEHPAWRLREPSGLEWTDGFRISAACFTPGDDSALCVDLGQTAEGGLEGRLEAVSAPLDLLAHVAGWPFSFSQQLSGTLGWSFPPNGRPSASAMFAISQGVVRDRVDDLELLNTQAGSFSFQVERGRLHSGQLDIPLDSGTVDVDFEIPDVLSGAQSELNGRIIANLDDLDALTIFIPQLVQTDGELRSVLLVEGTAEDPQLSGVIELLNGRTTVLAPGLRIREARLTGRLDDSNQLRVNGTFRAGDGRAEIRADVDATDPLAPTMEVWLKGDGLTLIDLPDLVVQADTDVSARWDKEALRLSGTIHVPSARFAPRFVPSAAVIESPDVVIVAGAQEQVQNQASQNGMLIQGELEVSLGEDVRVDLDVAEADLSGSATFKWTGSPVPLASGQYSLEGEIQAYGQTLEISRASVRFPDVPANNPHLDVRAERRIYGNPQISHAGVLVHGTLKRPITEAYTVPATNQDRARALLITGSDFNYEQGTGAVSVGTYISPKLYLAYGVGLFEEGNVITVRYDLKRNFGVKATSGQDDTGIDFSYTIER